MPDSVAREFHDTDRFTVRRRLGSGGFGTVYEVYDNERSSVVALKALRRADPHTIYRFKHEFRNLADIVHPNLATLYELISEDEQWFLTMELVRGVDFLEYVRGSQAPPRSTTVAPASLADIEPTRWDWNRSSNDDDAVSRSHRPAHVAPARIDNLRTALRQLAEGIHTLHQHGILHCDIKPSNVLVSEEGRVVLLDFG